MSETFVLREGAAPDLTSMVDMQMAMARESEGLGLDREVLTRGVTAVLQDRTKGHYWVAAGQDQPTALLGMLLVIPEWSDWRNGTVLWIHSVYVVPEARERGVYRALYAALKARVEADPALRGLRLYVDQRNERAQKVYARCGMSADHYHLYEWLKS